MGTTEPTINDAIARRLRELRHIWQQPSVVRSENTGAFYDSARPDILIMEPGTSPVILETEVLPAITVEKEAKSRLGKTLKENGKKIFASIALRVPVKLRKLEGETLFKELSTVSVEFACYTGKSADDCSRWPTSGWMTGDMKDVALVAQRMTIPPVIVEAAAEKLVHGVGQAAGRLDELAKKYSAALSKIAGTLKQEDGTQTRRMAMTIVANAFVFHASLAGQSGELAEVKTLNELRSDTGSLSGTAVLAEWRKILKVNFWPIFDIARQIVELLPTSEAPKILDELGTTAELILESGLSQSHDLVGAIFQNVIADRKFLAAFYTRPSSAGLLTELALSRDNTPRNSSWENFAELMELRVADFACGTGTLLSTVYQFLRHAHELAGGNEEKLHPGMMADVLVGCDIMPAAAHITASMLSGAHPSIKYENSSIMAMPYGRQPDESVALGALDLLKSQGTFPLLATHSSKISSKGESSQDAWHTVGDHEYDLVIMNPPFTRATNHEGNKAGVPNPMFAAFSSSDEEQKQMSKRLQKVAAGTAYHGNAGEASAFLALADKKLRKDGRLAMVLPLSLQAGAGWAASRDLLRKNYGDLIIVNIAAERDDDASFSADTGMGECLIIGTRANTASDRALFVVLTKAPATPLEGIMMARAIKLTKKNGGIRKLEQGPDGGNQVNIGNDVVGQVVDCPLPIIGHWPISRISDISLAQTTYQLIEKNRVWLPGMNEASAPSLAMCRLDKLASIGPLHRDINGTEYAASIPRGPFEISPIPAGHEPTYPSLWNHDADRERAILVEPDSQATIRTGKNAEVDTAIHKRADSIWATASHCHFNYDFRFNSQSTAAVFTERLSIGGRAWPSVKFEGKSREMAFVLWANTTLGLMCHWWFANKQQSGRGSITLTALPHLKILDIGNFTKEQLSLSEKLYKKIKSREMKPFNEIENDTARHMLDTEFLVNVLGLPQFLFNEGAAIDVLRRKLAREPSINGGKNSNHQDHDS